MPSPQPPARSPQHTDDCVRAILNDAPHPKCEATTTTAEERTNWHLLLNVPGPLRGKDRIRKDDIRRLLADYARVERERDAAEHNLGMARDSTSNIAAAHLRELLESEKRAEAAEQRARDAEAALRERSQQHHAFNHYSGRQWDICLADSCEADRALLAAQARPAEPEERSDG